jgi:tetratricopeptide (TPR) repeat protein
LVEEYLAKAQQANDEFLLTSLRREKSFLLATIGQFAEALELFQSELSRLERFWGAAIQIGAQTYIAYLQAELGQFAQARATLGAAQARVAHGEAPPEIVGPRATLGYVALVEGDPTTMRAALAEVQEAIAGLGTPKTIWDEVTIADVLHTQARLHLALGEPEAALSCSTRTLRQVEEGRLADIPEQHYFTHARALRALGRTAEADDFTRRAYERVMQVADSLPDESLRRSWLENVPHNRAIVQAWQA